MSAGYLFQPDKQYDITYDTGDKAIQCGRHVDIFKFWLMWKAKVCVLSVVFILKLLPTLLSYLECDINKLFILSFSIYLKGNSGI